MPSLVLTQPLLVPGSGPKPPPSVIHPVAPTGTELGNGGSMFGTERGYDATVCGTQLGYGENMCSTKLDVD
eukprot:1171522-Rhodomonas_salina.5